MGKIEAISRDARQSSAFTGMPPNSFFDVCDILLKDIPAVLLPVIKEPSLYFFSVWAFVSGSVDEQAVKVANRIKNRYLSM
jgi:hypothetical protein